MKEYVISKVKSFPIDWDKLPKAYIDTYAWMDNGYAPVTYAALCYDDTAMYVHFWANEEKVRAVHHHHGDDVYEDSCVELFIRPHSDARYMNFETNVIGKMLLGIGENGNDDERKDIPVDDSVFCIQSSVKDTASYNGKGWTLTYKIPFSFLRSFYGDVDFVKEGLRANLFKCGDKTEFEHYGMWSPVTNDTPNFHLPEYFGKMTFEI